MFEKEDFVQNILDHCKIGDFANFSLIDLITLQALIKFPEPIIRYTLYLEVNRILKYRNNHFKFNKSKNLTGVYKKFITFIENKKKLPTSSFYYSLSNLQQNGFIKFNYKDNGKIDTVEKTSLTELAVEIISQYFIRNSIFTISEFRINTVKKLMEKLEIKNINSLFVVWLSQNIDVNLLYGFTDIADDVFILTNQELVDIIKKLDLENIYFTEIYNNMIREPKNIIDLCIILNFHENQHISGLNSVDILRDLTRIVKPNGYILITARAELPHTNNFYVNEILKSYKNSISHLIYTEDELKDILLKAGLSNPEILDEKGMLVSINKI